MSSTKPIRALTRGLDVIQVLNGRPTTSISQLHDLTGLPRATLLRVLLTLEQGGWVYRCRANGAYRLSSRICELGQQLLTVDRVIEGAAPVLDRLSQTVGLPLALAARNGRGMRLLETTRWARSGLGNHEPLESCEPMLWSASGRAYLAFCPTTERETILDTLRQSSERPDQAAYDPGWIDGLVQETRARGYGLADAGCREWCRNGERDIAAMAVPIIAGSGVRACLSLYWKKNGESPGRIVEQWLPALKAGAETIADDLARQRAAAGSSGKQYS